MAWSNSTFTSLHSNKVRGQTTLSASMTTTLRLATSSTAPTPSSTAHHETLLALLTFLTVTIIFATMVTFLVVSIRKLKQGQDQFVRLQRLTRRNSHSKNSSLHNSMVPMVDFLSLRLQDFHHGHVAGSTNDSVNHRFWTRTIRPAYTRRATSSQTTFSRSTMLAADPVSSTSPSLLQTQELPVLQKSRIASAASIPAASSPKSNILCSPTANALPAISSSVAQCPTALTTSSILPTGTLTDLNVATSV
jgi:hypothetical protein